MLGSRQAYMVLPALHSHKKKRQAWDKLKAVGVKLQPSYADKAKAQADADVATTATTIKWNAEEVLA